MIVAGPSSRWLSCFITILEKHRKGESQARYTARATTEMTHHCNKAPPWRAELKERSPAIKSGAKVGG